MTDWQPTCELRITYRWTEIGAFKTKIFVHQQKWVRNTVMSVQHEDIKAPFVYEVPEEEWRNIPVVPETET